MNSYSRESILLECFKVWCGNFMVPSPLKWKSHVTDCLTPHPNLEICFTFPPPTMTRLNPLPPKPFGPYRGGLLIEHCLNIVQIVPPIESILWWFLRGPRAKQHIYVLCINTVLIHNTLIHVLIQEQWKMKIKNKTHLETIIIKQMRCQFRFKGNYSFGILLCILS